MWADTRCTKDPSDVAWAVRELFAVVGYEPSGTVFVKPNLSGRRPITEGENTTVYFMDGLLEVLHANGCSVVIGHSSLLGARDRSYPFVRVITDAGFDKYRALSRTSLLDLDTAPRREVAVGDRTYAIPEAMLDAESYINVAKLKTHMETGVSLCLKNQMGLMSGAERIRFHREGLDVPIAELAVACNPTMNLVEGIVAMEGNGPHHGADTSLGIVFGGTDMVELDAVIAARMGMDPAEIGHLHEAAKLAGRQLPELSTRAQFPNWRLDVAPAQRRLTKGRRLHVLPTTSCSRCIIALDQAGREMRRSLTGLLKLGRASFVSGETTVIIGTPREGDSPRGRVLCVGRCACEGYDGEAERLDACPPAVAAIRRFFEDKL